MSDLSTQIIQNIPVDPLTGSISTPIYQTATFVQEKPGVHKGYDYGRTNNPTRAVLENLVAKLENGIGASAFATGLAAIDAVVKLLSAGDEIIADGKLTKVYSYGNMQKAHIYGYGFQLVYQLINKIKVDASYQYTYGRILSDSTMPIDHIPPIYGRVGISWDEKRFQIQSWVLFNGKKELRDYYLDGEDNIQYANPNGLPAWYTINIAASWVLDKRNNFNLQFGIDNILDTNYRLFASGISAPGRNYKFTFRVRI